MISFVSMWEAVAAYKIKLLFYHGSPQLMNVAEDTMLLEDNMWWPGLEFLSFWQQKQGANMIISFFCRSTEIRTKIKNKIFREVRIKRFVNGVNYYNDLTM